MQHGIEDGRREGMEKEGVKEGREDGRREGMEKEERD